jgi:hypothetical protein
MSPTACKHFSNHDPDTLDLSNGKDIQGVVAAARPAAAEAIVRSRRTEED